jgi:hypothetical protein
MNILFRIVDTVGIVDAIGGRDLRPLLGLGRTGSPDSADIDRGAVTMHRKPAGVVSAARRIVRAIAALNGDGQSLRASLLNCVRHVDGEIRMQKARIPQSKDMRRKRTQISSRFRWIAERAVIVHRHCPLYCTPGSVAYPADLAAFSLATKSLRSVGDMVLTIFWKSGWLMYWDWNTRGSKFELNCRAN